MKVVHDKVINLNDGEDFLNTKLYSDLLYSIISSYKEEDPITIGLYGGWGTGKSSIVKTLESKIEDDDREKYGIFIYDAWKYSNDSLRRSLFLSLNDKFNVFKLKALKSLIYEDQNQDTKVEYKLNKGNLFLLAFILIATFVSCNYFAITLNDPATANIVKEFGLIMPFFELIIFFLQNTIVQYRSSVQKSKLFSPEQFENLFGLMISALTGKKSRFTKIFTKVNIWLSDSPQFEKNDILKIEGTKAYKNVIIVIDNIDRCEPEVAKEVLLTVKNFLSIKNCIFIIPIADKSITGILNNIDECDKDEFLRKYFNLIVRIQTYGLKDIRLFIQKIMQKNGLTFDSKLLLDIVRFKFGDTPRRIVQFFNNFQIEVELAKLKEDRNLVQAGVLTSHIDLLAVISIIKDNWSRAYTFLCSDPRSLYQIANDLRDNKSFDDVNNALTLEDNDRLPASLLQFIKRNSLIILNKDIQNWDPFFRLADYDKSLPDNLRLAIDVGSYKEIKEILDKDESMELQTIIDKCIEIFNGNERNTSLIDKTNVLDVITAFYCDENRSEKIDKDKLTNLIQGIEKLTSAEILRVVNAVNLNNLISFSMYLYRNNYKRLFNTIGIKFDEEAREVIFANEDKFIRLVEFSLDDKIEILKVDFITNYLRTMFQEHPITIIENKAILDRIDDNSLASLIPPQIFERIKLIEFPSSKNDLNYELAEYLIEKKLEKEEDLDAMLAQIAEVHSTHATLAQEEDNQVLHLLDSIVTNPHYLIYDEDLLKSINNYQSKVISFWGKDALDEGEKKMINLYLNIIVEYMLRYEINENLMDILRQSLSPIIKDGEMKSEANDIAERLVQESDAAFNWKVSEPLYQSYFEKDLGEVFDKSAVQLIQTMTQKLVTTDVDSNTIMSDQEVKLIIEVIYNFYLRYDSEEGKEIVKDLILNLRSKFGQKVIDSLTELILEYDSSNLLIIKNIDTNSMESIIQTIFEKNINDLNELEKNIQNIIDLKLEKKPMLSIKNVLNTLIINKVVDESRYDYYNFLINNKFLSKVIIQTIFNYCITVINDFKKGVDALKYLDMLESLLNELNKEELVKLKSDLQWMKKSEVKEISVKAKKILSKIILSDRKLR